MLKCPFHEDKDPSLKVYTNTNTFNCFGCGKAGDQIEFIQLKESGLQLGILKESQRNTVVPKFKNCVLFFTKNEKGQIIDIYGRSINPTWRGRFVRDHDGVDLYPLDRPIWGYDANDVKSMHEKLKTGLRIVFHGQFLS